MRFERQKLWLVGSARGYPTKEGAEVEGEIYDLSNKQGGGGG